MLSSCVNYFGLWFSALDGGNQLSFYNDNTLVYSFTSSDFLKAVGACPGGAYCGNPNSGEDASEQFAFINFFDNSSFNKIVFSELSGFGGDFESDNHTIGRLNSNPGGTPLAATRNPPPWHCWVPDCWVWPASPAVVSSAPLLNPQLDCERPALWEPVFPCAPKAPMRPIGPRDHCPCIERGQTAGPISGVGIVFPATPRYLAGVPGHFQFHIAGR